MVCTTKFYLIFQETDEMDYQKFNQIMWDIQKQVRAYKNRASSEYFTYMMQREQWKKDHGEYPKDEELLGYDMRNHLYHMATDMIPTFNCGNITEHSSYIYKFYKKRYKDILGGRMSIPSYKQNQPIGFSNENIKLNYDGKDFILTLSTFSNDGRKALNLSDGRCTFKVWHKCESSISILHHCISGEYKKCASQMQYDDDKHMWEFALSYEFNVPKVTSDKERILGVDLGIAVPIVAALSDDKKRWFFHGDEIQAFRAKTEAMRSRMKECRTFAGDGSVGHGRAKRMEPVDRIGQRVANFRDTKNNAWSRELVTIAVKHGCGTIQMEDLSGISGGKCPQFLKSWTYYDLQQKVKYKAEAKGIKVVLVDPKYTSQRCSSCGYISEDNRKTQSQFICQKCGYEENADYNAARNLSIKGINEIIAKENPEVRKRSKHKSV